MKATKKLILVYILSSLVFSVKAKEVNLDSLWGVWNNLGQTDTNRLKALKDIVREGYLFTQADSAFYFAQMGYELAKEKELKKYQAAFLMEQAISFAVFGDFARAIEYYTIGLKVAEEIGDKRMIAVFLNNMTGIYVDQQDYDKSIILYTRSLKIKEEIGDKAGSSRSLSALGGVYQELGNYPLAMDYYNKSQKIAEEIGDLSLIINSSSGIGEIYRLRGEYDKALENQKRCLTISAEMGGYHSEGGILYEIGLIYRDQGAYAKAIDFGERALFIAQKKGFIKNIKKASKLLYESYKAIGKSTEALSMFELHIQMRDSMQNEKSQKAIIQQELKYKYEKKALADSLVQVEKTLQVELAFQNQLHQKDQTRNILIALGIMALLLAAGLWTRNRFVNKTNLQLQAAKTRAERSEKVKEQFLSNMSHEIRTPMHAISGMVKILERKKHLSEQEVFLDAMHKSSDNLIVLLNDILDLSKIEAGKLDVESMPIRPVDIIENVTQILQFKAEEKGLRLHVDISHEVPNWIMGDPTRLSQILTNLAGNAIKFTEKGKVNISFSKKNDFLLYEVRDTGIGIAEDKLHSIFDAFEQAEGSTTRRFGGTGLGLNISRQLVELMGGNIWVESEIGKGSSFFVSLPLVAVEGKVANKQSLSEEQIKEMGATLSGKRILVADDNEFNQMIARDDLAYYAKGVKVDIVENGHFALQKAQTGDYDLILMDVQMPEMDGIEASMKLREWEQANGKSPIPIIAMTASLLKSEVNLCLEAGMNNYIPKPYEAEELVGTIYSSLPENPA